MAGIPLLVVGGDHRDVGRQIGAACAATLQRATDLEQVGVPRGGITLSEMLSLAEQYRQATERSFPWIVEELNGAAEGAGVDAARLFAASVEELWAARPSQPSNHHTSAPTEATSASVGAAAPSNFRTEGRCTDVLVAPPGTRDGHLLVGHNNDLAASVESDIVAIEWHIPGDPVVFSLGIGPWISVAWNDAGLSLTGNELSPNDEKIGVPRLLLVRAQIREKTLAGASALAAHPLRASAYNTVLADAEGECVNVEASATSACCSGPDDRHAIVHTNHYVSSSMLAYEDDPAYRLRSAKRLARANELLSHLDPVSTDEDALMGILSDHENAPDSICRHVGADDPSSRTKTVFWCVADVTEGTVRYGLGNPCESTEQTYRFE